MTSSSSTVLLIGYGNPGRCDDGLGPACAGEIEKLSLPGVDVDSDYQLMIETTADISKHDYVIFADASLDGPEPFFFQEIQPQQEVSFSTHSIEPQHILGLASEIFNTRARGFILGIRGYVFDDFGEFLSEPAQKNLEAAIQFIVPALKNRCFEIK